MEMILAQLAIALVLSAVLAPDIDPPTPSSLEDFDVPKIKQGDPIPVVFGTFLLKSANVLWYGDLKVVAVTTKGGK